MSTICRLISIRFVPEVYACGRRRAGPDGNPMLGRTTRQIRFKRKFIDSIGRLGSSPMLRCLLDEEENPVKRWLSREQRGKSAGYLSALPVPSVPISVFRPSCHTSPRKLPRTRLRRRGCERIKQGSFEITHAAFYVHMPSSQLRIRDPYPNWSAIRHVREQPSHLMGHSPFRLLSWRSRITRCHGTTASTSFRRDWRIILFQDISLIVRCSLRCWPVR